MFAVFVDFQIKPGCAERFLKRLRRQAADSLTHEPDCHVFDVCVDPQDERKVFLYEVYQTEAAFAAHRATAHFKSYNRDVEAWVERKTLRTLTRLFDE